MEGLLSDRTSGISRMVWVAVARIFSCGSRVLPIDALAVKRFKAVKATIVKDLTVLLARPDVLRLGA